MSHVSDNKNYVLPMSGRDEKGAADRGQITTRSTAQPRRR